MHIYLYTLPIHLLGIGNTESPCLLSPFTAPTLSAVISTSGIPTEGQSFSLTCQVRGAEQLATFNEWFRWDEVGGAFAILRVATLTFNPLRHADAGEYRCTHNFASPYLVHTRTVTVTATVAVNRKLQHTLHIFLAIIIGPVDMF